MDTITVYKNGVEVKLPNKRIKVQTLDLSDGPGIRLQFSKLMDKENWNKPPYPAPIDFWVENEKIVITEVYISNEAIDALIQALSTYKDKIYGQVPSI